MIKTFKDILEKLYVKEREILDNQKITHPGVIGEMYEGLTAHLLSFSTVSVFSHLDLRVVSGFICDSGGRISGQIDCMLVNGEGDRIPHTENYQYNINDVVVVIEVKKTLDKNKFEDALNHLGQLCDLVPSNDYSSFLFQSAYKTILNDLPPTSDEVRGKSDTKSLMRAFLVLESVLPSRILLAYNGYKTENGFRKSFLDILQSRVGGEGLSPLSLPSLIINDKYSIVKLSGTPFGKRMNDEKWTLLGSSHDSPLECFLEIIWTRLHFYFNVPAEIFGENLKVPQMTPLLEAKFNQAEMGWEYFSLELSEKELEDAREKQHGYWNPVLVSEVEVNFLNFLAFNNTILASDSKLREIIQGEGADPDSLFNLLHEKGLVLVKDDKFEYLTENLAIVVVPKRGTFAIDYADHRARVWLNNLMK